MNTPDLMDELLTEQAQKRTGVQQSSWLRVDDEWGRAVRPAVWCLACGDPICSAHTPDRAAAVLGHKADHAQEILDSRRRAFQALDPMDQMFTLPATARELEMAL